MGRRSILDEELLDRLLSEVRKGVPIIDACQAARIGESTFYAWRRRGEEHLEQQAAHDNWQKGDGGRRPKKPGDNTAMFARLVEELPEALAQAKATMIRRMDEHTKASWQATAWVLERRHPEEFGKPETRLLLAGDPEAPVQVEQTAIVAHVGIGDDVTRAREVIAAIAGTGLFDAAALETGDTEEGAA